MDYYDTAQICGNGHKITSMYASYPQFAEKFCAECGFSTHTKCIYCNTDIRGFYHVRGFISASDNYTVPSYCHECGKPYPWTAAKFEAVTELIDMAPGLTPEEKILIVNSLPDIARATPRSEAAVLKVKKLLLKSKDFGKKVIEKIVVDLASDQAKTLLLTAKEFVC